MPVLHRTVPVLARVLMLECYSASATASSASSGNASANANNANNANTPNANVNTHAMSYVTLVL